MRDKYYVEFVKRGYNTLDEARASAYRVIDRMGMIAVDITDEDGRPVGSVLYSRPGYKPYWKKTGNSRAYHVVEADGSITKR